MFFVPDMGGIVCAECANKVYYTKKQMPYKLRDFFKNMADNDFETKSIYEQKATEKVCEVCFEVLKEYIESKSPKRFKSSNVLHEITGL
jgi:protein-arginine kinase activator protein McsA